MYAWKRFPFTHYRVLFTDDENIMDYRQKKKGSASNVRQSLLAVLAMMTVWQTGKECGKERVDDVGKNS
ncbi:hypothetical protein BRE01_43670 [Brevibacillus reuszeri]|uniref:Uncharacterized protein n=1 Tax=Brevibacillus reuszeri TaxID=54915 RepID=A0A0K9YUX5_9BACL|nr:hypothetical protein ADS79_11595 [Brevibacillus reuszeri]GED70665.1 hypothetical protein BRE01_43670 [Brevibacillus reuszeri]